jgi:hypothetical protein
MWWIMYFSDAFDISDAEQYEWFDPILERDSRLFVDPFSIFADSDDSWQRAHDTIIDYFHNAFEILAKSGLRESHQSYKRTLILMESPEPKEFRLGYAGTTDGSGTGEGLAKLIVEAMVQAIQSELEDIQHFEELGILVEGISNDRIGDMTCNLLKPRLIEYTQDICRSLGVPMSEHTLKHSIYNKVRGRWDNGNHLAPADPVSDKPILLVPKRFLGELPKINAFDFDTSLRDDLNLDISSNVRKPEIVHLARSHPEALRNWVTQQEGSGPTPYDVDNDPKLIVIASLYLSQKAYDASRPTLALKPVIYGASITKSSPPNSADLLVDIALQNLGTQSLVACDTVWEYTTLSGTPLLYFPSLVEVGGAVWTLPGGQVHQTRATLTVEPDPNAGVGETAYIAFWFECQAPNLVTAAEVVEVNLRTGTIPDDSIFGVEELPPMSSLQRAQKIMGEYHETVPSSPPSVPPYKLEPAG